MKYGVWFRVATGASALFFSGCIGSNGVVARSTVTGASQTEPAPKAPALVSSCISSRAVARGTVTARVRGTTGAVYGFLEYLPFGYQNSNANFPVIIHLHGIGEAGDDHDPATLTDKMSTHGPLKRIDPAKGPELIRDFPALVFAPQNNWWFTMPELKSFVDYILTNYRVDRSRIYLTGLSMGGGGVWNYLTVDPDRIAAAVANCGAPYPAIEARDGPALSRVPHLAIHSKNDGTVNVAATIGAGNILGAELGAMNRVQDGDLPGKDMTVYYDAGARRWVPLEGNRRYRDANGAFWNSKYVYAFPAFEDHGTWGATYANEDTWNWLFCQRKP